MKISTFCLLGGLLAGLLISVGACATGIIPVLELDFTRSATETLKKRGIDDACIISAANPSAFTYCREGSATLWKYQALDLEQQATIPNGEKLLSMVDGRISIAETDSAACGKEAPAPLVHPAITRGLALGLITLFVLIGLRHTYRATLVDRFDRTVLSGTPLQRSTGPLRSNRSTARALWAFAMASAVAVVYFGYTALCT